MAEGVWKGRSKQLSLNKFFDLSTPSMRKGRDGGGKGRGKEEKTDENSGQQWTAQTPTSGTPHARAKNERPT